MSTIVVAVLLITCLGAAIYAMFGRKKPASSCGDASGTGCSGCTGCGH